MTVFFLKIGFADAEIHQASLSLTKNSPTAGSSDMTSQLSENNTPVVSLNACRLAGIPSEPLFSVKALLLHHQHTFCDLKLYKITACCSILATESFSMGLPVALRNWRWCLLSVPKQLSKYSSFFLGLQCCRITVYKYFRIEFPSFIWERLLLTRVAAKQLSALSWLDYANIQIQNISAVAISFLKHFFTFIAAFTVIMYYSQNGNVSFTNSVTTLTTCILCWGNQ